MTAAILLACLGASAIRTKLQHHRDDRRWAETSAAVEAGRADFSGLDCRAIGGVA